MQEPHFVLTNNKAKVLIMMSPDCPLCKNYTKDIKELMEVYSKEFQFYGVIPGRFHSTYEVDSFLTSYNLSLDLIYDTDFVLTNQLKATITPEVFLINNENEVIYQGLFDNWLGELGRRRQVVTEYYLKDALESFKARETIRIPKTKAIGCFIE
jgi:thiol-disulfide isomerase/thioredoxin